MSKNPDKKPENNELVSPSEDAPDLKSFQKGPAAKPCPDDDITLYSDNVVLKEHLKKPDGLIGLVIADHFRIDERLAEGGMSAVYKAKDLLLGRTVAIKVLLPGRHFTEDSLLRFQREAKAVGSLSHPNIVGVYEMNTFAEGEPYIAMEFVDGETLADFVRDKRGLPVETTIDIMRQCASALAYAHKNGIIHRDIKSGNIMLSSRPDGGWQPKLVDFGIARALEEDAINLTRTGDVFGSPRYMSPEQCRGEKIDARTDIYSLGCAFYESLTGDVPFKGASALDTMRMHNDEQAIPPSQVRKGMHLSAELDRIVLKCLAKDRAQRYQTADALEKDLITISQQKKNSLASVVAGSIRKLPFQGKGKRSLGIKLFAVYFLVSAACLAWVAVSQGHFIFDRIWSDFDYRGQKAFDRGDHKEAAEHFQTALKIAETLPLSNKQMKLAISLTEMVELSTATGDKKAHEMWLQRRKAQALSQLDDVSNYRGQQIKLCNESLERFIAETKSGSLAGDKAELRLKARQVLERFNELSGIYDSDESLDNAFAMTNRAVEVTSPYLEKTDAQLVQSMTSRAWLSYCTNKPNVRELISEAETALNISKEVSPALKARDLSFISQVYLALGEREASRKCSEESINILRANSQMQTDTGVQALLVRALLENETHHPDAADFFFNQAKFEMSRPEEHSLAIRERYAEARLSLLSSRGATQHSLEISKAILEEEERRPTTRRLLIRALFSTGMLCGWLGAEREGIALLERASAVAENNHEPAAAGAALDMIGEVLGSRNRYNDAIPYFRRARDIYVKHRDLYSNSVVATSNNLALLLMKQSKYEEARKVLQDAELSANLPSFGSPRFKQLLYDRMVTVCEKLGDMKAAEGYRQKLNDLVQKP